MASSSRLLPTALHHHRHATVVPRPAVLEIGRMLRRRCAKRPPPLSSAATKMPPPSSASIQHARSRLTSAAAAADSSRCGSSRRQLSLLLLLLQPWSPASQESPPSSCLTVNYGLNRTVLVHTVTSYPASHIMTTWNGCGAPYTTGEFACPHTKTEGGGRGGSNGRPAPLPTPHHPIITRTLAAPILCCVRRRNPRGDLVEQRRLCGCLSR